MEFIITFVGFVIFKTSNLQLPTVMSHGHYTYTRHTGAPIPQAGPFYRYTATFLGATMWFWIFYRAKHDWKHWVGIEHPWDHQH